MSGRFQLGDRVQVTGCVVKTRRYKRTFWQPEAINAVEGVIVGRRTVYTGWTEWIDGMSCFTQDETLRVWLVAWDLHRNPLYCTDDQVKALPKEES